MIPLLALVLFSTLFLVAFVLRSLIQRVRTGDSGLRLGGLRAPVRSTEWIAAWMMVLAMACALLAPLAELVGLAPWIGHRAIRLGGAAVTVIGTALIVVAQLNMGDQWRVGVDSTESTSLVTSRAFAIVRNPVFSALLLAAGGLAAMVLNVVSLIGFVLFVAAVEVQVRHIEEPYLRSLHPVEYAHYTARVGRFAPWIGRASDS